MNLDNKGFTLIEVLLAILLISVGSLATTKLLGSVVGSNHSSGARIEAASAAQNILSRTMATISTGGAVPVPALNQNYVAGDADIVYDLDTRVMASPLGAGFPSQVFIKVTVRHPGLAKGDFSMQAVVMTPQ